MTFSLCIQNLVECPFSHRQRIHVRAPTNDKKKTKNINNIMTSPRTCSDIRGTQKSRETGLMTQISVEIILVISGPRGDNAKRDEALVSPNRAKRENLECIENLS